MTRQCGGRPCAYWKPMYGETYACHYYFVNDKLRILICPAGEDCTVRKKPGKRAAIEEVGRKVK